MTARSTGTLDFAVGLDVGTTKICALSGIREGGRTRVISMGSSPSHGLRKGMVVDTGLAADSIKRAVKNAEEAGGIKIRSVVVGIAGGHIKGFNCYGAIGVKSRMIREEDVDRLMDSASAVYVPVDREILHVIPAGFRLDGSNGIRNPVGMSCERLEAMVHIVTGSVTSVQNLIKCCEMSRVRVADIVLEPLASADAVLTMEERERGVALVDIGGGTTDVAVYREGVLKHTAVLALGGNHITNDIAVGLGIAAEEAERLKKLYGHAVTGIIDERGELAVKGMDGRLMKLPVSHLFEIIQPRCEEIVTLAQKEIGMMSKGTVSAQSPPLASVVLTGGTSLLRGLDVMAGSLLRLPVRIGVPGKIINEDLVNSPEYATGVGLVQYGLDQREQLEDKTPQKKLTAGSIFERMKYWAREYFT
jgi:cell division protein FtsA